jgi:hypothetical protein
VQAIQKLSVFFSHEICAGHPNIISILLSWDICRPSKHYQYSSLMRYMQTIQTFTST